MVAIDGSERVLDTIKPMLGIQSDTSEFDLDILTNINAAWLTLLQLGVCRNSDFYIVVNTCWDDIPSMVNPDVLCNYLYLKTKRVFDPPNSSGVISAIDAQIKELEFRISVMVDSGIDSTTG